MDKNKVFQTATRLEQKGQFDRAVAEYERLVKYDPNEVRALLRIGGLYQKKGENEEAARALEKAAESYANQGFFLKAVAVYKQVLKLAPSVGSHQRLADLYQQLGLLRDAMAQLQLVLAAHEREGRTGETTAVLRKMLDLDPENALGRARLGELLIATGDEKEGRKELGLALEQLEKAGRSEEFLRVADRLLQSDAPDPELARKVAKVYLDKGEPRKALARLQVSFKADSRSVETLALLARGFQELGDTKKTASVYKEMARLHAEAGRTREEREAWKQVLRLVPDDAAARAALSSAQPARSAPPAPPPLEKPQPSLSDAIPVPDARGASAPKREPPATTTPAATASAAPPQRAPAQVAAPPPAKPEDAARLLAELDVYLKYKLFPKAQAHLQSLLALDPDGLDVQERAALLAEGTGDREGMRISLLKVARIARQANEAERARKAVEKLQAEFPGDPEVEALGSSPEPGSVSGMILVDEAGSAGDEVVMAVSLDDEPLDSDPIADGESSTFPLIEEDSALQAALELSTLDPSEAEEVYNEPLLDVEVAVPSAAGEPAPGAAIPEAVAAPKATPKPKAAATKPEPAPPPVALPPQEPKVEAAPEPRVEAPPAVDPALDAEIDEATFYVQQEMWEEAEDLLRALVAKAPDDPRVQALAEELKAARPPEPSPAPPSEKPAAAAPSAAPSRASRPPPPSFAKALTVEPAEEGSFDLAEELLGDLDLGPEEEKPQAPADFQYSVEEVLEEFKKGVSQVVRPEDSETHYNLGIAYKEMGLFSEAIGAFQQAIAGCKGTKREIDCMITAGLCQMELGAPMEALPWFQAGLGAAALSAESALALHYEIGCAYEALNEKEKALEFFSKVHRSDPGYREVAVALERLQNGGEKPTDPSSLKKGKVGYV